MGILHEKSFFNAKFLTKPVCIVERIESLVTQEQNLMNVAIWWLITMPQLNESFQGTTQDKVGN